MSHGFPPRSSERRMAASSACGVSPRALDYFAFGSAWKMPNVLPSGSR
jgi:hypothetical protein